MSHLIDGGTVIETGESYLLVDVDGVEVFVTPRVVRSGCQCCGDETTFQVSYNRLTEYRIENHGEADPLGIMSD